MCRCRCRSRTGLFSPARAVIFPDFARVPEADALLGLGDSTEGALGATDAAALAVAGTTARLRLLTLHLSERSAETSSQEQSQYPPPGRADCQPAHESIELLGIHSASPEKRHESPMVAFEVTTC